MKDERIAEIYESLGDLVIELDKDPGSRGPGYLQDLISKTRGYLNKTSYYLTEVLREVREQEMELEALEAAFAVASDDLMANDRRVSTLPAVQDRLSMINVLLAEDRRQILAKRRVLKNLGHVERVIRHRHKELENTMSAIRLQRSLLETEIRTGSFYGDESEQSRGTRWGKAPAVQEDIDGDEIERLLKEAAQAPEEPPKAEAQEVVVQAEEPPNGSGSSEVVAVADDDEILRFLDQTTDEEDLFKDV